VNDIELLRSFRETQSDEAFRELVRRHIGMVYAVALRRVRNADWADEVAHAVFIALARKARSLSDRTILAGWLYRATRFAAGKLLRDEERRARHEKEAAMASLNDCSRDQEAVCREDLGRLLFETLDTLSRRDRDAILLRFIENRSFAEVGAAMGTTEAAAKMRTGRALEKLRERLNKRGANVVLAALPAGLTAATFTLAPTELVGSVSSAALGQTAATSSATSLAGSVLSAFTWAKVKIAAVVALALIMGGATTITALVSARSGGLPSLMTSPDDMVRRNRWIVDGRNVRSVVHEGQSAVDFDSQPGQGIGWREGFTLSEGVIEADIAALTGHVGLAFWVQDSEHYSAIYFRPQNRPEDPVNGSHGVQYVALPQYGWERLRGEKPGAYENSVSLPAADSGVWFHARIEVSPAQVRAFVNNSARPCLVVTNLLTTNTSGSVGLFMGSGSRGIFSRLKAQPGRK
jgi:RNA polymerase sigma factor (sigma-70 family)